MNLIFKGSFLRGILLMFFFVFTTSSLIAVPAYPGLIDYRQPHGDVIELYLMGDEKINWARTPDGYTILANKTGEYQYAVLDANGDLSFSGVTVSNANKRNTLEEDFLASIPKGLIFSKNQKAMMLALWEEAEKINSKSFPTTGSQRMLAILVQTPDKSFTKTREEFYALFNQINYTEGGARGSLRDYYLENSWGQFDLVVDVVGPVTASESMSYYATTSGGARILAAEAIRLAHPEVNYADYDRSGDGYVDGFYMIFAGYGQEAGGGSNTIWSHAWSLWPSINLDGKIISRYACSPELRGNTGENITRIGVIGHEFGHIMGAPDYYDTDGEDSGGLYPGTGRWDMMAGGTWNNGGATPAHHNVFTKTAVYRWAEQIVLDKPGKVKMYNSVDSANSFYRINTLTPGEYFLLENRTRKGFDSSIPGEGMIVYRVHSDLGNLDHPLLSYTGNSLNVTHPQKMYIVSAGANFDPGTAVWTYGDVNSVGTPFPGSTSQTYFSDDSRPSSKAWARSFTNKPITNISRNAVERTISFDFMQEEFMREWLSYDNGHSSASVGLNDGGVFQIATRYTPEKLNDFRTYSISAVKVYVSKPGTYAALKIWQGSEQATLVEYISKNFNPLVDRWVLVELDQPFIINPDKELWIGAEFNDPGEGYFPAGRDMEEENDGKGNLLRVDIEDPDAWVLLSDYDMKGNWSIQAMMTDNNKEAEFIEITLTADPPEGGSLKGFGKYAKDSQHTIFANANENYRFRNWTENGTVVSTQAEYTFEVNEPRSFQANFAVSATNVAEVSRGELQIFPNPVKENLTLQLHDAHTFDLLKLYNIKGQRVYEKSIIQGDRTIEANLRSLQPGVYMLVLQGRDDVKTRQIVVK